MTGKGRMVEAKPNGVPVDVLVADDDDGTRGAVCAMLEEEGFSCRRARNGVEALALFEECRPDLVVLDVMMPKMDGFQVCERIRRVDEHTPVLFLSAKGDIVDKRIGFQVGADDYLSKPFSGEELTLRVGALLRRAGRTRAADACTGDDAAAERRGGSSTAFGTLELGALTVDVRTGDTRIGGERVELTPKESRIMAVMAEQSGQVFGKEDLIRLVWGDEYVGTAVGISVYIRRIREKIEPNPSEPIYLKTVWKVGYRLG